MDTLYEVPQGDSTKRLRVTYVIREEYGVKDLSGEGTVRRRLVHLGQGEDALVQGVEVGRGLTVEVVPPVTHEEGLVEHGAVGAQEGGLATVQVAVVPHLRARRHGCYVTSTSSIMMD